EERAKPAVPFGGKYRLIDFTLSNCVNSGIYDVGLLTQYRPRSLYEHIEIGRPWDLDRMEGGITILQPYLGRVNADWYSGTADAVYRNLIFLENRKCDLVFVLSGDHIYKMDYSKMLDFHRTHHAELTIAVIPVEPQVPNAPSELRGFTENGKASRFGIMLLDEHHRIIDFEEKPIKPKSNLASMGVYLFQKELLIKAVSEDAEEESSDHDFGKNIVPKLFQKHRVFGYEFQGYWRDVGTVASYYEANMDLLKHPPLLELDDPDWIIHTKSEERPPAKLDTQAKVRRSLVANGCVISGYVENSILFPGVMIEPDVIVKDSIIMTDSLIAKDSVIERTIIDKLVQINENCHLGYGEIGNSPNAGIVIIGKTAQIPKSTKIGRGCTIDAKVQETDFPIRNLESGTVIHHQ
ncbi:MAG: glucose-1-phosphate adenylyltransferase subunit GlgD, partial [bacterium]|nr:glucose-1-phosphate adenylyltransferase subunit GlgD [bacterium]